MSSRILSQIFNQNNASIYDALREHDAATASDSDMDDLEERAGMRPIARPRATVHDDNEDSYMDDESTFQLQERSPIAESTASVQQQRFFPALSGPRDARFSASRRYHDDDDGSEVPQSLLFEPSKRPSRQKDFVDGGESVLGPGASITGDPGPSTIQARRLREQWDAATAPDGYTENTRETVKKVPPPRLGSIQPKERAMWKWANVENLDNFLQDVGHPVDSPYESIVLKHLGLPLLRRPGYLQHPAHKTAKPLVSWHYS